MVTDFPEKLYASFKSSNANLQQVTVNHEHPMCCLKDVPPLSRSKYFMLRIHKHRYNVISREASQDNRVLGRAKIEIVFGTVAWKCLKDYQGHGLGNGLLRSNLFQWCQQFRSGLAHVDRWFLLFPEYLHLVVCGPGQISQMILSHKCMSHIYALLASAPKKAAGMNTLDSNIRDEKPFRIKAIGLQHTSFLLLHSLATVFLLDNQFWFSFFFFKYWCTGIGYGHCSPIGKKRGQRII